MENSFDIFSASGWPMCEGYPPPPDNVLIHTTITADESTTAMAMWLLYGENPPTLDGEGIKLRDGARLSLLVLVLDYAKERGMKDLHKIVDLPISVLQRWNEAWERCMPSDDVMSVDELKEAFGEG